MPTNVTKDFVDYIKPLIQGRLSADHGKWSSQTSGAEYWKKKENMMRKTDKKFDSFFDQN